MSIFGSVFRFWRRDSFPRRSRSGHGAASGNSLFSSPSSRLLFAGAATLFLVWLAAAGSFLLRPARQFAPCVVGQVADRFVYCEEPFEYEDVEKTRIQQELAERQVPPVFEIRAQAVDLTQARLMLLRELLQARPPSPAGAAAPQSLSVAPPSPTVDSEVEARLKSMTPGDREALEYLLLSQGRWPFLERLVSSWVRRGVAGEEDLKNRFHEAAAGYAAVYIQDENSRKFLTAVGDLLTPAAAAAGIAAEFSRMYPDQSRQQPDALAGILAQLIVPNLALDRTATQFARQQARQQVAMVRTAVPAGAALLKRGELITPETLVRFEKYNEIQAAKPVSPSVRLRQNVVPILLFLVVLLAAAHVLHAIHPEAVDRMSGIFLIGVVLILQFALTRGVGNLLYHYGGEWTVLLPVILPLSFGAMLFANLVGLRTAVWGGIIASLAAALQFEGGLILPVTGTLASFVAAVLMRRARRRYQVFWTGMGVAVIVAISVGLFYFGARMPFEYYGKMVLASVVCGLGAAILAGFVSPLFEYMFGITTDLYLLEVSDLNHPLLKRLQLEAPGTYHHSLMVATLAEEAAAAIGANRLLARVCAYFHDIGKLSNPDYFTENAMGEDPHEDLRPRLSSLVILNHVKSGLELAARYKLKRPIREAIAQHHGTSLVVYFYRRAVADQQTQDPEAPDVGEHDYRYPGPLPSRREVVIVSLSDSFEAAARSLEKPTPQKIRAQIEDILERRIADGQLNDADLTFKELTVVKESIIRSLTTMYHGRIKYPKAEGDEGDETERERRPVEPEGENPQPDAADPLPGTAGRAERLDR